MESSRLTCSNASCAIPKRWVFCDLAFVGLTHLKSSLTQDELENLFVRYNTKTSDGRGASATPDLVSLTMSLDAFTAFLLSCDNSAFTGQNGKVYQPMTHPLSDYFISSSHNTYLVGHQLVGYSTIEGYVRALLRSCRSVECMLKTCLYLAFADAALSVDIYDGENEPMVFHGKTLTSKVSAREVCEAIMKYAFVTSPYPIIISAEIHCSLPQQEMLAIILHEVFGEALVSAPMEGKPLSGPLPSPEDLKGRVLLKVGISIDWQSRTRLLIRVPPRRRISTSPRVNPFAKGTLHSILNPLQPKPLRQIQTSCTRSKRSLERLNCERWKPSKVNQSQRHLVVVMLG